MPEPKKRIRKRKSKAPANRPYTHEFKMHVHRFNAYRGKLSWIYNGLAGMEDVVQSSYHKRLIREIRSNAYEVLTRAERDDSKFVKEEPSK